MPFYLPVPVRQYIIYSVTNFLNLKNTFIFFLLNYHEKQLNEVTSVCNKLFEAQEFLKF